MKSSIIAIIIFMGVFTFVMTSCAQNKSANNAKYLEIGQLLFSNDKNEFVKFFNSFATDKAKFISEYEELLEDYDNFDFEKLTAIDVLYIFGDSKEQLLFIDWKGEENEKEVESFIEKHLNRKVEWVNAAKFRKNSAINEGDEDDENFVIRDFDLIIDFFKEIDKDLQQINQRLIFLSLDFDAYVLTTVDVKLFEQIITKMPNDFHGTDKLRK